MPVSRRRGVWSFFEHTHPESDPGPSLSEEESRALAEDFLASEAGLSLDDLRPTSSMERTLPHRSSYSFEWQPQEFDVAGAEFHHYVWVSGDKVDLYFARLQPPESWSRRQDGQDALRWLLYVFASAGYYILLAAACVVLAVQWRARRLDIRPAVLFYAIPFALRGIQFLNGLGAQWIYYETTESHGAFVLRQLASYFSDIWNILFLPAMVLAGIELARTTAPGVPSWPGYL